MNKIIKTACWQIANIILVFLCCLVFRAQAGDAKQPLPIFNQQNQVTGQVKSADVPLSGVTITSKQRPNNGTSTDKEGNYAIQVSENDTLLVSSVGYIQQR